MEKDQDVKIPWVEEDIEEEADSLYPYSKLYSEVEYNNWIEFKPTCTVRADNLWQKNTCKLTDDDCIISNCFAFQLVKLLRGYF